MDENIVGKVLFIGIVGLFIWAVQALLSAKSEGARRTRLVIGGAVALGFAAFVFAAAGPIGFLITAGVLGAIVWITKGFKK